jgi:hypothetical protein
MLTNTERLSCAPCVFFSALGRLRDQLCPLTERAKKQLNIAFANEGACNSSGHSLLSVRGFQRIRHATSISTTADAASAQQQQ